MRILAIHSEHATHDSSCCIYDGKNITYFLEERYSGEKHDDRLQNCFHNVLKTNLTFDKIIVGGFHAICIHNNHNYDESLFKKITKVMPTMAKKALGTPMFFTGVNPENLENELDVPIKHNLPEELIQLENYKKIEEGWEKTSEDVRYFLLNYYKKYKQFPIIEYDSNHHLNHAALSFYNSGFDEAIVFVADGAGEISFATAETGKYLTYKESESLYVANYKDPIKPIYKNYGSYSGHDYSKEIERLNKQLPDCEVHFGNYMGIGLLYSAGALQIGETADEAGKAMGLSSYGTPTGNIYTKNDYFVDCDKFVCECHDFIPLFEPPNGYPSNFKYKAVEEKKGLQRGGPESLILLPDLPVQRLISKTNYKPYANLAKDLQLQTQDVAVNLIKKAIDKTGLKKVCICGGYGMNILSNSYYTEKFPDVEFYFEPLSIDSGLSIGIAMRHYRKETGDTKIRPQKSISFHGFKHDVTSYKGVDASVNDIAKLLYDNKSVAVYTGLAEAGQRALGNRSILFNALNADAKDIVNKIKRREWYRPFAVVVLEEDAELYFDMGRTKKNLFMTQSFDVKTDLIPGVTHVDNTCRVQTVSEGYLYDLLVEFKKLSGHGILLNTSFNLAGKPLVETPKQAIETLNTSVLDYLWFEETGQLIT
jgi:carbamoyltransferase